jgi:outer membrane protein W
VSYPGRTSRIHADPPIKAGASIFLESKKEGTMLIVKGLIFILSFWIATLPDVLCAQGPTGTGGKASYAVLKLGSFLPESSDLDKQDAKSGFTGQVGFGYYLARFFALEIDLGYLETRASLGNLGLKYGLYPLEVTGRFGLPLGFLEPYLAVGLGGYYVKTKAGNLQDTSTRAGFFGGGGINLNLGETFFIGAEARYLVLNAPTYYVTPYHSYATGRIDLDGVIVTGNIGFRF